MGKQSPLRLLVETISNAVTAIEEQYGAAGLEFPSLNDPLDPADPANALLVHPDVSFNTALLSAAAGQLVATIRSPHAMILEKATSFHITASLGTVSATNVPEILREAGRQGMHVDDIGKKSGMHPDKLARILRLLCTYHIFTEVKPDVFAHNRISSTIDKGKSVDELFSKPKEERYKNVEGIAAMLELCTEEHFKTSAAMTDTLTDPETSHSDGNTTAAFNRAYNTQDDFWTWLGKPGNEFRNQRFIAAMDSASKYVMGDSILQGFPWGDLPDGAKIVDVGGNVGSASIIVAAKYPTFKVVIQDLGHVVKHGAALWNEELPGSIESGRVELQEHNFFSPQPVKDADVFLLRRIIHDWGSSYAIKILRHLREAAVVGKTKLVIVDSVVQYACRETDVTGDINLPDLPVAPEPMLPNFGTGGAITYLLDVQMMTMFNGQERTLGSFVHDTREAGWKITAVYAPPSSRFQHVVAEAV